MLCLAFSLCFSYGCERVVLPSDVVYPDSERVVDMDSAQSRFVFATMDTLWRYFRIISLENGGVVDSSFSGAALDGGLSGEGTESVPFNAYSFTCGVVYLFLADHEGTACDNVWLGGFVVGFVQGRNVSSTVFGVGNVATNIVIADSPLETDYKCCVPVQLGTSSSYGKVREQLNLRDNPDMLGKYVVVCGRACSYMGVYGLRNTKCCRLN